MQWSVVFKFTINEVFVGLMAEHFDPDFLGVLASWREDLFSHQG